MEFKWLKQKRKNKPLVTLGEDEVPGPCACTGMPLVIPGSVAVFLHVCRSLQAAFWDFYITHPSRQLTGSRTCSLRNADGSLPVYR